MPLRCLPPSLVSHIQPAAQDLGLSLLPPVLTAASSLGIGGNQSLRGPKPYTLLPPAATVQAPYTLTQIAAARDAAPIGGVVRFPHAGSPYPSGALMNRASQTWQLEFPTTVIGGFQVTAQGCTFEGGVVTGTIDLPRGGNGHNFTARNFARTGGGLGIQIAAKNNTVLSQFDFTGLVGGANKTMLEAYYSLPGETIDGLRLEHGISPVSLFTHHDLVNDGGPNTIKNFVIHNCWLRRSVTTDFVVEVFNATQNAAGLGAIVEYSDMTGGEMILSIVAGSNHTWVHHNRFIVDFPGNPFSVTESAGIQQTGSIFEYNEVFGNGNRQNGGRSGGVAFHNSSAHHNTFRFNKIRDIDVVVSGGGAGGGYTVENNCLTNFNNIFQPGQPAFTIPNIVGANGANSCGY